MKFNKMVINQLNKVVDKKNIQPKDIVDDLPFTLQTYYNLMAQRTALSVESFYGICLAFGINPSEILIKVDIQLAEERGHNECK